MIPLFADARLSFPPLRRHCRVVCCRGRVHATLPSAARGDRPAHEHRFPGPLDFRPARRPRRTRKLGRAAHRRAHGARGPRAGGHALPGLHAWKSTTASNRPRLDFNGLDCWTFFETSLGFARMLHAKPPPYAPEDLLRLIELDRYRHGQCTGQYLSRIHFLEELFYDNEKRGLLTNITRASARGRAHGTPRHPRDDRHVAALPLPAQQPDLLPEMARIQEYVSDLPVYHVPKRASARTRNTCRTATSSPSPAATPAATPRTSGWPTATRAACCGFCMHRPNRAASWWTTAFRVSRDKRDDAGIIVARPSDVPTGSLAER